MTSAGPAEASDRGEGELIFLTVPTRTRERTPPVSSYHGEVLLTASKALAAELADDELPGELRAQLAAQVGELIATAWTPRLPNADVEMPEGLRRLALMAVHSSPAQRRPAEAGLRRVVEVIADHGRSFGATGNAAAWLARLEHPIAVAALFSLSREAETDQARLYAATRLGELAARRSRERFTELCARLLLE